MNCVSVSIRPCLSGTWFIRDVSVRERRKHLDAKGRILSELAEREQALDRQIEVARAEVEREIEAAEAEAARIVQDAERRAQEMQREREAEMAEEGRRIRAEAQQQVRGEVEATSSRSEGKLSKAVETILRAVLP